MSEAGWAADVPTATELRATCGSCVPGGCTRPAPVRAGTALATCSLQSGPAGRRGGREAGTSPAARPKWGSEPTAGRASSGMAPPSLLLFPACALQDGDRTECPSEGHRSPGTRSGLEPAALPPKPDPPSPDCSPGGLSDSSTPPSGWGGGPFPGCFELCLSIEDVPAERPPAFGIVPEKGAAPEIGVWEVLGTDVSPPPPPGVGDSSTPDSQPSGAWPPVAVSTTHGSPARNLHGETCWTPPPPLVLGVAAKKGWGRGGFSLALPWAMSDGRSPLCLS